MEAYGRLKERVARRADPDIEAAAVEMVNGRLGQAVAVVIGAGRQ